MRERERAGDEAKEEKKWGMKVRRKFVRRWSKQAMGRGVGG